ncbi:LysR family transcriptional regulator [Anaeromyxobacter terrae]|uniref:LysR family transcriptional regulator n=1 Tax=Anaeromyxobacter terrae TaxID=2925406 RepID=UPI001F5700EB|nr:LysR family transcriptional regulator [Anaeromyxobacter sp. SG22]
MQRLRWDDAQVLLALLQARSFSGAGARLGVNASTASRRLDALERALGAHLFDRTPDGVLPTALAEELGPHAEAMERAAAGLALAVQGREALPEGEVRLTAPPGVAEFLVAPALPRLLRRHPRLRLSIDASVTYADLTRREADLALRTTRPASGDLVVKKLGETRGGVYGAPAYASELGVLRRLDEARWITWGDDLGHLPPAQLVAQRVPQTSVVLKTSHMGAQFAAASAGTGVLLSDPHTAKVCGLVEITLAPALRRSLPPLRGGALWLVAHRALRDVPRIAALWAFLEEEARGAGLVQDRRDEGTGA